MKLARVLADVHDELRVAPLVPMQLHVALPNHVHADAEGVDGVFIREPSIVCVIEQPEHAAAADDQVGVRCKHVQNGRRHVDGGHVLLYDSS